MSERKRPHRTFIDVLIQHIRQNYLYSRAPNPAPAQTASSPQLLHQISQPQQILDPETRAPGREHHKWILLACRIGPVQLDGNDAAIVIEAIDVLPAPAAPVLSQLELPATLRMKRMRDCDAGF